jgi:hypothetical protein
MTAATLTTTAAEIVNGALRLIGEIDANQPTPADQMQDGLEALNFMVKAWQSQGLHLWTKTEGILPLDVGKSDYTLGPNGDECGNLDDFVNTDLTVATVAGITRTLDLTSTAGMDGANDILPSDPTDSTAGWTVVAGSINLILGTTVRVDNGAGSAGEIERTITGLTVGRTYRVIADFTLGTSPSCIYSVKEGALVLGTDTISATGTSKFDFTATQTSHTFNIKNGDTAGTNTTLTSQLQILDTTTGDLIGIRLDDDTRQWTKIVEVLSATQVRIAGPVSGASAIGKSVFSFPALIPRPIRLLQVRRQTIGNNDEEEAREWSRQEYFAQTDKTSQGTVNNWYYSPQLTDGRVYIWQTASDVDQVVKFTYIRPIDISTDTADAPDFPAEWFRVLKFALAVEIAPEYRLPQDRLAVLSAKADQYIDQALGHDRETASMNIQPDFGC